jgi:acetylornithine/N-succinyldiaminopimelate aminotransferase
MDLREAEKIEKGCYANTFSRFPVVITRGEGMYAYDTSDKRYLDMFAGIAVNSLGHCHPEVVSAIKKQSERLIHTSNWFYTLPQLELAKLLVDLTGLERAFITNDGTEAVETAIKLARKATGKRGIIAMENAFHGRTMGSLSITWGEKYRKPFLPLVPGMKFARYDDIDSLREKITNETAAVIVEPIQGEAGVIIPEENYLKEVRELTEENDVLLILDEIQTGFGRTGELFAFQHSGIKPDILCLAKGLGGGFPIGATLFDCEDFKPGEHGGTFIGNPLACSVANTVVGIILRDRLAENARCIGAYLLDELDRIDMKAHGRGLMIGVEVRDGRKTVMDLIEKGILTIHSGKIVRVLPPLIIERKHADEFLSAIGSIEP